MTTPADGAPLSFDDQVVVVTGAGRGMGRAHAMLLAERGARVVVNDLGTATMEGGAPSGDVAAAVVEEIRARGGRAVASADTVASPEGARAIIATAIDTWGRVDAVIHNAGLARFTPLPDVSYDEYRAILAVHIDGAFLLTQAAWPHMAAQRHGRVLYVSSTAGLIGVPNLAPYAMAKTAMLGLMNVVKLEGAGHGIQVNILAVAAYTRMTQHMLRGGEGDGPSAVERWWERYLTPELVAPPAAWLIHPDCPLNGQVFDTKGGYTSRLFLGSTPGYANLALTPEDVRDHMDDIRDESGYRVFWAGWESAGFGDARLVDAGAAPPAGDPEPPAES